MKPIVPSLGYTAFTTGPPASLTRSSEPRLVTPIATDLLASNWMTSLFCEASLSRLGFSAARKSARSRQLVTSHAVRILHVRRTPGDRQEVGRDVLGNDHALVGRVGRATATSSAAS